MMFSESNTLISCKVKCIWEISSLHLPFSAVFYDATITAICLLFTKNENLHIRSVFGIEYFRKSHTPIFTTK